MSVQTLDSIQYYTSYEYVMNELKSQDQMITITDMRHYDGRVSVTTARCAAVCQAQPPT